MKFINFFLVAVIGSTLMACNAEDQPEVKQHETDSYASITVKFPGKASTRALPGDYNLYSRTLITRRRYPAVAHPYP